MLGICYPLFILFIAQIGFPYQANGSLIVKNNIVIGSELIGQSFASAKYFHSRPSAVDYNASGSGASNYGPSSEKFIKQVAERIKKEQTVNKIFDKNLPADMVLASASGLDPHISLENAFIQAYRVARIRGVSYEMLKELIEQNTDNDFFGIWGRQGVNVLN